MNKSYEHDTFMGSLFFFRMGDSTLKNNRVRNLHSATSSWGFDYLPKETN